MIPDATLDNSKASGMTYRLQGCLDTVIEILLIPCLPLAYVVWLRWRRHERETLVPFGADGCGDDCVACDGGNKA